MSYEQRIIKLIESDELRMSALRAARALGLPGWLIAAGFVRNLVWGRLFDNEVDLGDIDVVYFCTADTSKERDQILERRLCELEPGLPWSVKNQARMHLKHGDTPYKSTLDAMRYWPEKQTSIGVMLDRNDDIVVQHCFDLGFQFNGNVDHNPARTVDVFKKRVSGKGWLKLWPALQIKT
ncbi:nucleotidyltransferase family protein [Motiliproteus sp. MSK22-1]|uniref:nucleotidyltransferase family protein n=1 Tax=Motiliproteus sp. MSK22-1 TaxID=1897630 RepID=UPI0009767F37|nr:nucleotidyltransferase family protein [Motiliproteus sp. MSK22-1]OMH30551.1 hypothetical protein BGP75_17610 [Motiliproteus sp. MSK22-1]